MDSSSQTSSRSVDAVQKPVLVSQELIPGRADQDVWKEWVYDIFALADKALSTSLPRQAPPPEDIGFLTGEAPSVQKTTVEPSSVRVEEGIAVDPDNVLRERLSNLMQEKTGVVLTVAQLPEIETRPCRITYRFPSPISAVEGGAGTFYVNDNRFVNGTHTTQLTQVITADDLMEAPPAALRDLRYETQGDVVRFSVA